MRTFLSTLLICLGVFFFLSNCKKNPLNKNTSQVKGGDNDGWDAVGLYPNHHLPFHFGKIWNTEDRNITGSYIAITSNPNRNIHATYVKGQYGWDFGVSDGVEVVAAVDGCIRDVNDMGWKYDVVSRWENDEFSELGSWEFLLDLRNKSKTEQVSGVEQGTNGDNFAQDFDTVYAQSVNYVVLHWIDGSDRRDIDQGKIESLYMHMDKVYPWIRIGTCVKRGTPLGTVGATGFVSGAHMHYQVQKFDENHKHFYSDKPHFFQQSVQVKINAYLSNKPGSPAPKDISDYNPDLAASFSSRNIPKASSNNIPDAQVPPLVIEPSQAEQSFNVDDKSPWGLTGVLFAELKNEVNNYPNISEEDKKPINEYLGAKPRRQDLMKKYNLDAKWKDFVQYYEVKLINDDKSLNLPLVEDFIVRQACDSLNNTRIHTCANSVAWLPSRFQQFLIKCGERQGDNDFSKAYEDCDLGCNVAPIGQMDYCKVTDGEQQAE